MLQFQRSSSAWLLIGAIGVPVLVLTLWSTTANQSGLAIWIGLMCAAMAIIAMITVVLQPRISFAFVGLPAAICGALWGLLPHVAMPPGTVGQGHVALTYAFILPCSIMAMSTIRIPAYLFNGAFGVVWLTGWIRNASDEWNFITPTLVTIFAIALVSIEMSWRVHRRSAVNAITARHEGRIDPLTGLLNRRAFTTAVDDHLEQATDAVLFFIDLDDFKLVSDLFGYDAGDQLLAAAAMRIRRVAPASSLIGRVGGDEIALFVPQTTIGDIRPICDAIVAAFENVFVLGSEAVRVEVSIGAASAVADQKVAELLRRADQATLEAKRVGVRSMLYSPELSDQLASGVQLRARLTKGLEDNEFVAYLQPVIDVTDNRVLGFEALARWQTSDRVIEAGEFHAAAAASGLLPAITRVVATQVAECIERIESATNPELAFGINVDISDLEAMLDWIDNRVSDPTRLVVEVTEHDKGDQILSPDKLASKLNSGVRVVLDDFGVAFSSFGRVLDLPIAGLKIDASFVRDMLTSDASRAVIEAILTVAESMGLSVVAEGVETAQQSATLAAMGVHMQQGYLHSRALPIEQALALLTPRNES